MHNHELEELLDHRPPEQPRSHAEHPRSYAATAATAADRPLTSRVPCKDAKAPLAPKIKLGANFVAPSSKSKGKSKVDSPLKKDKGRATSPTVTPFMSMDYEDLVDNYEGMSEEEWDRNRIAALESNLARQVHTILNDERFSMPSGGSGSSFVEGRVRDITPENPAQFQFAVNALESAHRDQKVTAKYLLTAIRRYVTEAHKASHKTDTQRSAISQWRTPDWANMLKYDPVTQKVVSQGVTKGAAKAQKHKAIDHGQLLEQVTRKLQFEGSRELLGNMSSPCVGAMGTTRCHSQT
jgi:hypothetical protein